MQKNGQFYNTLVFLAEVSNSSDQKFKKKLEEVFSAFSSHLFNQHNRIPLSLTSTNPTICRSLTQLFSLFSFKMKKLSSFPLNATICLKTPNPRFKFKCIKFSWNWWLFVKLKCVSNRLRIGLLTPSLRGKLHAPSQASLIQSESSSELKPVIKFEIHFFLVENRTMIGGWKGRLINN